MTNIDRAIVEAVAQGICQLIPEDGTDCPCDDYADALAPLIADAVTAAEAEGFKRGAAAVREAVEGLTTRWEQVAASVPATLTAGVYNDCASVLRATLAATEDQP